MTTAHTTHAKPHAQPAAVKAPAAAPDRKPIALTEEAKEAVMRICDDVAGTFVHHSPEEKAVLTVKARVQGMQPPN